jgi:hypothetical protein
MTRALTSLCIAFLVLLCGIAGTEQTAEAEQAAPPSPPQPPAATALNVPPPEVLLVLIRTTLDALNQAVQTGNFTVLRDLGSPIFQQANSPAQLGVIFADLRNRNIDLSPVVVVTPQITEPPSITPEQLLRLVGYFPTNPLQVQFQMLFQPVNGQWRLYGMAVNTIASPAAAAQGTPAAPNAQAAPNVAKPATPAKKKQ